MIPPFLSIDIIALLLSAQQEELLNLIPRHLGASRSHHYRQDQLQDK